MAVGSQFMGGAGGLVPTPGGLARYPIKTMILVAFGLLILQGISQVIRQVAILRGCEAASTGGEAHQDVHL